MRNDMEQEQQVHPIPPLFDSYCRILILGSFPSPKSREAKFFYHHPQNRFWKVISGLTGAEVPKTILEKKALLLNNHIAVWDVVHSCQIKGASDSSIRNVIPTDLSIILDNAPIKRIFANGNTAFRLYMKYSYPKTQKLITRLPSTSPANAAWDLERLLKTWNEIIDVNHKVG